MEDIIFEVTDKTKRKIRLTKKQWRHIKAYHPNVETPDEIHETLKKSDKITFDEREDVNNFYKYFKHKKQKSKYLKVIVKYLNGDGFVMSVHYARNIK